MSKAYDLYLKEISRIPTSGRKENIEMAKHRDVDGLVRHNLRFALKIALEYKDCGMPAEDLVGAGNMGLIRAANDFDPERNITFPTYAVFRIRQCILSLIGDHGRTVRLPRNRIKQIYQMDKIEGALCKCLQREPTPQEIATQMGIDVDEVYYLQLHRRHATSLDAPVRVSVRNDKPCTLMDITEGNAPVPLDDSVDGDMSAHVEAMLTVLDHRERRIIKLYYGFGSGEEMTLDEIGQILNLTKERVRQIRDGALKKLRHPTRMKIAEELK